MRRFFFFILLQLISISIYSQPKIDYGNNKNAGSYYPIRGINIYIEQYGKGKPLILLHGNGGSIHSMESIIPFFSTHYKVIAIDSRAHGKSIDNADSLSFEMLADDLSALLDSMKIDSTYIIGWSDGGITALQMALRHPKKVSKLACTGANLWPDSTAILPIYWKEGKKYYDATQSKKFTTDAEKNHWKLFMLDWTQPTITLKSLANIKCPSLIISGDHDDIALEHTIKIFQGIENAQLWIVPNSGHATLIEHTTDFNEKVVTFFKSSYLKK